MLVAKVLYVYSKLKKHYEEFMIYYLSHSARKIRMNNFIVKAHQIELGKFKTKYFLFQTLHRISYLSKISYLSDMVSQI